MRAAKPCNTWLLCPVLIIMLVALYLAPPSYAQLSVKGIPHGLIPEIKGRLTAPEWIQMPEVDVQMLMKEDEMMDGLSNIPFRFGKNLYVNLNLKNSGKWDVLEDGGRLWRLGISSKGAISLNFAFNRYYLPKGARVFLYSPDGKDVIGAFTEINNQDDGYFATTLIPGNEVIIEYFEPQNVAFPGELNLWRVTHGYRGPKILLNKAFGNAGECNVNVACIEDSFWQRQIRSVGMLVVGGNGVCSGALINNTRNDGTPYFLSANHCYSDPSTLVFWFNWQSETCQNPVQIPPHAAMSGAITRARHSTSDFWLLQLNQAMPDEYYIYFSGWNRTTADQIGGQVVGIHHPRGDIKKVSWANGGVQRASHYGAPNSGTSHWRVGAWSDGTTTEYVSSGSPLFDSHGRIIGQLTGGWAACGNTLPDWYGRLGVSWTGGGTDSTRLSNWLDPLDSGIVTLDGFDPMSISGPSIVCNTNTTFSLGNLPPGSSVTWTKSGNLTYVSGQDSANYTVKATGSATSGEGWVEASITGECGTLVLRKDVWVGIPQKPSHIVFVPHTPCTNQFVLAYFNEINPPISQAYYQWSSGDHVFFPQGESSTWFQTK